MADQEKNNGKRTLESAFAEMLEEIRQRSSNTAPSPEQEQAASSRPEDTQAPDADKITLTEADLKLDEPTAKQSPEKSDAGASSSKPAVDTTTPDPIAKDAAVDAHGLPGMKVTPTNASTPEPESADKKKTDPKPEKPESTDDNANKWAHLSAEEAKLLEYLKKYFGADILTSKHLSKEFLKETVAHYKVQESLFNTGIKLPVGNRLSFTNKDKNTKSSFTFKKENDGSVSSVYTGNRENFINNVDAWAKNLLINQHGPMTVTLTSGTPEEKYLMKLALESLGKQRGKGFEITVEGFNENTLDTKQLADIKSRWQKLQPSPAGPTPPSSKGLKSRTTTTSSVASQPQPTHTNPVAHDKPETITETVATKSNDFESGKNVVYTDEASLNGGKSASPTSKNKTEAVQEKAASAPSHKCPTESADISFSRTATGKKGDLPRNVTKETFAKAKAHIITSGKTSASELTTQFGMNETKARAILDKLEEQGVLLPRRIAPVHKRDRDRQLEMS